MNYPRITESKWATLVLLERIRDMHLFESLSVIPSHSRKELVQRSQGVSEFITLNSITYKVEHNLFVDTIASLKTEGIIRVFDFMPMSITELIENPLVYAQEERLINDSFTYEDLDTDTIFRYEILLIDFKKLEKNILALNQKGISVLYLENSLLQKTAVELRKNTLKGKKISFNKMSAVLNISGTEIQIPKGSYQHSFYKSISEYEVGEVVEWEELVLKVMGDDGGDEPSEKAMQTTKDAMYAINRLVQRVFNTEDALFKRRNHSVVRNF